MKRIILTTVLILAMLAFSAAPAAADSGSFTSSDGQSCTYFGSGGMYTVSCSGYNYRAGTFVNCDYDVWAGSVSYRCRDGYGNTWSGSR